MRERREGTVPQEQKGSHIPSPPLHPRGPSLTAAVRDVPAAKALPFGPVEQPRALEEESGGEDVSTQRGEHVERGRHPALVTAVRVAVPARSRLAGRGAPSGSGGSEGAAPLRPRSRPGAGSSAARMRSGPAPFPPQP